VSIPPGGDDYTVPSPSSGRAGRPGGEPTVPAGSAGGGPPPSGPPPPGPIGPGASDRGAILTLGGSTLAGLAVGAILALVVGGGGSSPPPTTSTSTSTSTSTTSSTTTTTSPAAPRIVNFAASPNPPSCGQTVTLIWSSQNATSATLTDNGAFVGNFQATDSHGLTFSCGASRTHSYRLSVTGAGGQQTSSTLPITAPAPPTTAAPTTTTTTT
jgi:hypothetical protein